MVSRPSKRLVLVRRLKYSFCVNLCLSVAENQRSWRIQRPGRVHWRSRGSRSFCRSQGRLCAPQKGIRRAENRRGCRRSAATAWKPVCHDRRDACFPDLCAMQIWAAPPLANSRLHSIEKACLNTKLRSLGSAATRRSNTRNIRATTPGNLMVVMKCRLRPHQLI